MAAVGLRFGPTEGAEPIVGGGAHRRGQRHEAQLGDRNRPAVVFGPKPLVGLVVDGLAEEVDRAVTH